uniref:EF-hand domain-containing protein n=3 Tax=Oryza TaxID=4527 RepID=A0A0D3FXM3_9ORYZ
MLPADLMRAVVPVFPPSESNIVREGRLRGERNPGELHCAPSEFFMLFDTNGDRLISFAEYIFFVTLLSIPESSFSAAFKMFDVDHSGEIDKEEFKKVMALMRSYNRQGANHRDGLRTGLKVGQPVENGGVVEYFFGNDGNEPLHYDKFTNFLKGLHDEIIRLEFSHYDVKSSNTIPAKDFALSMVASADMNHINKLLDRVDNLGNDPDLKGVRITFEEFKSFADLRRRLEPLAMAIFTYGKVNGLLTKQDLKRAAHHVCGVDLTDRVVDIIFHVFDTNHDGNLSSEEFVRALQRRETDVRQPATPGSMGLLSYWLNFNKCSSLTQMLLK